MVAARILADVGDVARFADRNRFASWTGTAPLDASSGEQIRHRLSRAGNRKMNHVLHIAAACQARLDTPCRGYYRRKLAQGKTRLEAMRCLKRRISDAVYRQLLADARRAAIAATAEPEGAGPGGHCGASLKIQRGRLSPAHRHFGSATSRTRKRSQGPGPISTPVIGQRLGDKGKPVVRRGRKTTGLRSTGVSRATTGVNRLRMAIGLWRKATFGSKEVPK